MSWAAVAGVASGETDDRRRSDCVTAVAARVCKALFSLISQIMGVEEGTETAVTDCRRPGAQA